MARSLHYEILSYPYWGTDRTQQPIQIAGGMVGRVIEDIAVNQEPLRTNYNHNNINVLMRPAIQQDTSQMGTVSNTPQFAVTDPGKLYSALLDSVPDVNPKGKSNGPQRVS